MWKKVTGPTILVSLLWVLVSGPATYYSNAVYESYSRVLAEDVTTIEAAGAMQAALWKLHATVVGSEPQGAANQPLEVADLEAEFQQQLKEAERTSDTPEEQMLSKLARERFAAYQDNIVALAARPPGSFPLQADAKREADRLARLVDDPCRQLVEVNRQFAAVSAAWNARLGKLIRLIRIVFLVAGPILGIVFGLWVARTLHRSISEISITLKDAAGVVEGEIGRVEVAGSGDLPALHQQVNAVAAHIRQIMDQLQEARRQALSAERLAAVGQLAAGVAHELRNPLTAVKLLVQTAGQKKEGGGLREKPLRIVEQEIARMENTIQGLLDFARPPRLARVRHDLRTTVRRALNLVAGRAEQQTVTIVENLPDTRVCVDGDPEQLYQVFVNLSLNGIEAMVGGGTLKITMQPGGDLAICRTVFSDTGPGIPRQILEQMFVPFVTGKERGTGLGLAISQRIITEHGGRILAANAPDGGAVITVELLQTPPDDGTGDAAPSDPAWLETSGPLPASNISEIKHAETSRH